MATESCFCTELWALGWWEVRLQGDKEYKQQKWPEHLSQAPWYSPMLYSNGKFYVTCTMRYLPRTVKQLPWLRGIGRCFRWCCTSIHQPVIAPSFSAPEASPRLAASLLYSLCSFLCYQLLVNDLCRRLQAHTAGYILRRYPSLYSGNFQGLVHFMPYFNTSRIYKLERTLYWKTIWPNSSRSSWWQILCLICNQSNQIFVSESIPFPSVGVNDKCTCRKQSLSLSPLLLPLTLGKYSGWATFQPWRG